VLYAIKAVGKSLVTQPPSGGDKAVQRLRRERDALFALQGHPCVVQLHGTHRDERHVYIITEACLGGELWRLLREAGPFNEGPAAFYTAAVVLALEAAHSRNLAYRDLKPENILIDAGGWPRLADFGAAVHLGVSGASAAPGRTHTRFGTLEYMSPEVCRGASRGHSLETDWWSLGALVFEMLVGRTPCVHGPEDTDMDVLERISKGEVLWPRDWEGPLTPEATSFLEDLLVPQEDQRLGHHAAGGAEAVKMHAYLNDVSFDAILNRAGVQPPWLPNASAGVDALAASAGAGHRAQQHFDRLIERALTEPYDAVFWEEHFATF